MLNLIWLIPLLPMLGFLVNALGVWRVRDDAQRERLAGYIASGAVVLSFLVALVAFFQLGALPGEERRAGVVLWEWMGTGRFHIPFGFLFDPLSAVMVLLVTGVSSIIHIYSIGYMHGDSRVVRYFAYLNLFVAMMLCLVMADNLLLLFLGWEGVGLCSFLLIGHWYDKKEGNFGRGVATPAAAKAFIVNRIGDAAMLLAMMALFFQFETLTFFHEGAGFLETAEHMQVSSIVSFLLLIGVTGKSAQIPLFVWLPDAMAGPTPVSALIHAATMVTAGVYLIARTHVIFTDATLGWVTWVGAITALLAATAAVAQMDIKKVLAYSTVSQLGYMVAAAGMGAYAVAIFHLLTHGVFKALLFLGSGSVIHGTHETQDMRKMGGLRRHMPVTYWTYLVGAGALAGIFPLAGFWSKDEILAHAWTEGQFLIFVILVVASLATAFYMGRQIAMVFWGNQRDHTYHAHESGQMMTIPLIVLAVGSLLAGAMNLPGRHALTHWLEPVLHTHPHEFGVANWVLAMVMTLLAVGSAFVGWRYYTTNEVKIDAKVKDPLYHYTGDLWELLEEAWFFDAFYEKMAVVPGFRSLAAFLATVFDKEGIDGAVNGVGQFFTHLSSQVRSFQSGYMRTYALVFLVGVIVVVGYF
ncbi:MAG: NADH-quinone oxidoreductase subunit L [Chloroflexaceae bacterium]|nr:NADH-quinone oxidoreductase subunit L [Chloroflexaceae bacterium]